MPLLFFSISFIIHRSSMYITMPYSCLLPQFSPFAPIIQLFAAFTLHVPPLPSLPPSQVFSRTTFLAGLREITGESVYTRTCASATASNYLLLFGRVRTFSRFSEDLRRLEQPSSPTALPLHVGCSSGETLRGLPFSSLPHP